MSRTVLLIGPCGAGKSTAGALAARMLGRKFYDLDKLRRRLYRRTGYSRFKAHRAYKAGGIRGWYEYQKPYELLSVVKALDRYPEAVIACGGGQSVYDGRMAREFLEAVEDALVILLIPYEDAARSLELLDRRVPDKDTRELNRTFVTAPSNYQAADVVIRTGERDVRSVAEEIALHMNCDA